MSTYTSHGVQNMCYTRSHNLLSYTNILISLQQESCFKLLSALNQIKLMKEPESYCPTFRKVLKCDRHSVHLFSILEYRYYYIHFSKVDKTHWFYRDGKANVRCWITCRSWINWKLSCTHENNLEQDHNHPAENGTKNGTSNSSEIYKRHYMTQWFLSIVLRFWTRPLFPFVDSTLPDQ